MPTKYTIRQGDCLSSIALQNGFHPDTIWGNTANAEISKRRQNPNVLLEGDIVVIPDKTQNEVFRPTDQRHKFVRRGVPEILFLVLLDECDEPRRHTPYTLIIDGTYTKKGTTNGEGQLKERIAPNAREGWLVLGDGDQQEEIALDLGYLNPITEVSGVQMRLSNLGYDCGSPDGIIGPRTLEAIRRFQQERGLQVNGELDGVTTGKLQEIHGS